ncbi:MAG: hypothetical protein ACREI9_02215, partial [Nitrospiraceae bacterium]
GLNNGSGSLGNPLCSRNATFTPARPRHAKTRLFPWQNVLPRCAQLGITQAALFIMPAALGREYGRSP